MRPISFSALLCIVINLALPQGGEAQARNADSLFSHQTVPGTLIPAPSLRERASTWMMVGGGALLGAGWATNALGGLGAGADCSFGGFYGGSLGGSGGGGCQHAEQWETFRGLSLVPAVGPWAQLVALPEDARGEGNGWTGWLIASGLIQTSGLVLLLVGMAMKLGEPEPSDDRSIVLTPTLSPSEAGLTVSGAF